jgi:transcriptional regulator with XRE-family HTH domain
VQDVQLAVGKKIRKLRMSKKWSQDVFADRSGIHRAQVGAIERWEMNVTLRTLKTVADTLKVKIRDLTEDV